MPEGNPPDLPRESSCDVHVRSRDSTGSLRPPSQRPEFGNPWGARHPIGRGARHPHHTPTHAYSRLAPAAAQRPRPCHHSGASARDVIMFRRLPGRNISTFGRGLRRERARRPRRPTRRRSRSMAMAGGGEGTICRRVRPHPALPPQRLPATDGRGAPPLTPSLSCSGTVVALTLFLCLSVPLSISGSDEMSSFFFC